jgi:hypothetical protein
VISRGTPGGDTVFATIIVVATGTSAGYALPGAIIAKTLQPGTIRALEDIAIDRDMGGVPVGKRIRVTLVG